jgi:hypothetical protein
MKRLLLLSLLGIVSLSSQAQFYKQSAGVRGGYTSALTYKYFYNDDQAIELMVGGRNQGIQITGLYTFHKPLNNVFSDMVYFYYGVGLHTGYEIYTTQDTFTSLGDFINNQHPFFIMGIDTMVGLEYRMLSIPLTVGLDIKPYFQLVDMRYGDTRFWDVGASVKYVF